MFPSAVFTSPAKRFTSAQLCHQGCIHLAGNSRSSSPPASHKGISFLCHQCQLPGMMLNGKGSRGSSERTGLIFLGEHVE